MKPPCGGVTLSLLLIAVGGAGGCASSELPEPLPTPPMPTMAAATAPRVVPPAEGERLAAALKQARAGEIGASVETIGRGLDAIERGRLARELATTLAAEDPARAASFALGLPAGGAQLAALDIAARALAERDADAAIRWSLGLRELTSGMTARRAVAERLSADNPRGAVDRLLAVPQEVARDELLGFAAAAWARRDAEAAVDWARGLSDGELKTRLVSSVGFEVAQTNPARAIEVAELLPAGRNRWLLTSALAQTWVVQDPKAAFAWANRLPTGEARDAAYAGFDTGLGMPSSRRIAGAPGTRGGSSRTRGGVAAAAARREGDTPSFELWLASQRSGMSREEAILEYVRQRGAAEPGAIGQWLTTLPPGTTKDRALEVYVENVLASSPREAANFLQTLPRSDQTPEMLERTARRLLLTDPATAERWIRDSALPEFRKQELLREIR